MHHMISKFLKTYPCIETSIAILRRDKSIIKEESKILNDFPFSLASELNDTMSIISHMTDVLDSI